MSSESLVTCQTAPVRQVSTAFGGRSLLLGALLVLCVLVAYFPAIRAGFVWDDNLLVTANPQMQSAQGLKEIWLGKNSCDYTPLTSTAFWLEKEAWQNTPTGYHVVNLLIHAMAVILLWRILMELRIPGAWLAAFLFAIHPVMVASVAWVAELKNTLSATLFFGSILMFLVFRRQKRAWMYALALMFFCLAGLSKGAVVTLPIVLCGALLWTNRKITRGDLLQIAPFGAAAMAIACLTVRYQSHASNYGLYSPHFPARVVHAFALIWLYLRQLVFPVGLSPILPQWHSSVHSAVAYLPAFSVAAVLGILFWKCKTWGRPLLLVFGYYVCLLLPVLGLVWMALQQEVSCADWWQYLAAPGILSGIAAAFTLAMRGGSKKTQLILSVTGCVVLSLLLVQTWRRTAIYQSMETFCRAVLAENPHAWTLQTNLGVELQRRGQFEQAIAHHRQALRDNPRFMEAHNNLGNALSAAGRWDQAETEFLQALRLSPSNPVILGNLSDNYFRQEKIGKALAADAAAIRKDRYNPRRYVEFGVKLAANRQFNQAVVCFKNALMLDPRDIVTRVHLARALTATGRAGDAAAVYAQALRVAKRTGKEDLIRAVASAEHPGPPVLQR
jgi:protein O-mannosyl-transferase